MDRLRAIARGNPESDDLPPGRLVAFSDGIFAIAITLLAFQLRVPDLPAGQHNALGAALRADAGQFVAFALTFVVVGVYWRGHHRLFHFVRRADGRMIWLNLLALMGVSTLPFVSALMGRYDQEPVALAMYAGALAFVGLCYALLWRHATRGRRLVDAEIDARQVRSVMRRTLTPAILFALSIPLAYASPAATRALWLVGLGLYFVVESRRG